MKNQPPETPHIDVQAAFDPELRQGDREFNDIYLQNRPYQDQEGNVYDPAINEPVKADKYFDNQRQIIKDFSPGAADAYEDMSISALAHKLGEAEFHGDKTSEINISEVLLDKMAAFESKMQSEWDGIPNVRSAEFNPQSSENLLTRVRGIVDREIASLEAKQPKSDKADKKDGTGSKSNSSRTTSTLEAAAKRAEAEAAEAKKRSDAKASSKEEPEDTKDKKPKQSKQENPWNSVRPNFLQFGEPNAEGLITVAAEFTRKGDVLKWGSESALRTRGLDREIAMEGKDGSVVFVEGNKVAHFKRKNGKLVLDQETVLAETNHLPDTELEGKEWRLEGWAADGSADIVIEQVKSAIVKVGSIDPKNVDVPLDKVNGNALEALKTMLRREHLKQRLQAEMEERAQEAKRSEQNEGPRTRRHRFLGRLGLLRSVVADKSVRDNGEQPTKVQPRAVTQRQVGSMSIRGARLVPGSDNTKSTLVIPRDALPGGQLPNGSKEDEDDEPEGRVVFKAPPATWA